MEIIGTSNKLLNRFWPSQILLLSLSGGLVVFWHYALSICIMSKDWAGIWREWPGSSFLLSLLGDLMNPLHQLLECSSTLGSGYRIPHLGQFSHVLTHGCQVLEWASILKARAVCSDSFHFISKSFIWAHTFAKNWALPDDLLNRQRIWILLVEVKMKLTRNKNFDKAPVHNSLKNSAAS